MTLSRLAKNSKGFTLVELMIVVAIIGILAAIALPQFAAYRTRSYNANAKALNKMIVSAQADLNAELGAYGFTANRAAGLMDLASVTGGDPATGTIVLSSSPLSGLAAYAIGATDVVDGGRLTGNNGVSGKQFSVPLGLGADMACAANAPTNATNTNNATSYVVFTKAFQGDTAYGADGDVPNVLYSVSNPSWVGNITNNALQATIVLPVNGADDVDGAGGAGAPTATWERI